MRQNYVFARNYIQAKINYLYFDRFNCSSENYQPQAKVCCDDERVSSLKMHTRKLLIKVG